MFIKKIFFNIIFIIHSNKWHITELIFFRGRLIVEDDVEIFSYIYVSWRI